MNTRIADLLTQNFFGAQTYSTKWSSYINGDNECLPSIYDYPEFANKYKEADDSLKEVRSLLYGDILGLTISKQYPGLSDVIKVKTPRFPGSDKYPPYSFKLQCRTTGRLSKFIPIKNYNDFGITTENTNTGGSFLFPKAESGFLESRKKINQLADDFWDKKNSIWFAFWRKHGVTTPSWNQRYSEYLNSVEWKQLRKKIIARDGNKCSKCNCLSGLQVHHLTYERVGEEADSDLVTLCRSCHEKIHNIGVDNV